MSNSQEGGSGSDNNSGMEGGEDELNVNGSGVLTTQEKGGKQSEWAGSKQQNNAASVRGKGVNAQQAVAAEGVKQRRGGRYMSGVLPPRASPVSGGGRRTAANSAGAAVTEERTAGRQAGKGGAGAKAGGVGVMSPSPSTAAGANQNGSAAIVEPSPQAKQLAQPLQLLLSSMPASMVQFMCALAFSLVSRVLLV